MEVLLEELVGLNFEVVVVDEDEVGGFAVEEVVVVDVLVDDCIGDCVNKLVVKWLVVEHEVLTGETRVTDLVVGEETTV